MLSPLRKRRDYGEEDGDSMKKTHKTAASSVVKEMARQAMHFHVGGHGQRGTGSIMGDVAIGAIVSGLPRSRARERHDANQHYQQQVY